MKKYFWNQLNIGALFILFQLTELKKNDIEFKKFEHECQGQDPGLTVRGTGRP